MKKKRMNLIAGTVLLASLLAGCGGAPAKTADDGAVSAGGTNPAAEQGKEGMDGIKSSLWLIGDQDKAELSLGLRVGVTDREPDDMWFFKYYEEMTGVHMNVTAVVSQDWNDKKTIMLASGDYPGIIWGGDWTTREMTEFSQNGTFLDLTDYIRYMPNYKREMDGFEGTWKYVTSPDGGMYSLASINPANYVISTAGTWIKRDWLKNVGAQEPETLEEFYQVLRAFKEKDADGDGNPDNEIPLSAFCGTKGNNIRTFMLNSFGFDTNGNIDFNMALESWNSNTPVYMPLTVRYREYLAYMKKLMNEGLIDQDMYSQDEVQCKAKTTEGRSGVVTGAPQYTTEDYELYDCIALKYDKDAKKVVYQTDSVAYGAVVITDNCEDPELAAKWIDLFYAPENAYNLQAGPIILEYPDGTLESRTEGITEDPGVGCHIVVDEDGKFDAVTFPYVDDAQKNPDNLGPWDWLCLEHPANGMFNSTLSEYYYYGCLYDGFPGNLEEEMAFERKRSQEGDKTSRGEGYSRYYMIEKTWDGWTHGYPAVYPSSEQQAWLDEHKKILEDYVFQMEAKFITGAADLDTEYDAYIEELKKKGADEYQKIYVDLYNK